MLGICENKWEKRNMPQGPAKWVKAGQNAGTQDNFMLSFAGCLLPGIQHLGFANILYISFIQLLATKVGLGIGAITQPFLVRH